MTCWQDLSSDHKPMASICPVSSAMGIKVEGGIKPSVGCCQRLGSSALFVMMFFDYAG
jgi:hypothetical protein